MIHSQNILMRDAPDSTVLAWVTGSGASRVALARKAFWGSDCRGSSLEAGRCSGRA